MDDPVEAILVDLQHVRVASPATDIHALLSPNLAGATRQPNLDTLLSSYHTTFKAVMEAGEAAVPFSLADLKKEYNSKALYGIMSSLIFTPSAVQEEIKVNPLSEDEQVRAAEKDNVLEMLDKDSQLRPRLLAVVDEWTKAKVIS